MSNLATEKLDLDQILVLTNQESVSLGQISNNTSAVQTNTNILQENMFEITQPVTRPTNTTAYAIGQAFGLSSASSSSMTLGYPNKMIQIDEILITDDNQNSPLMTPTIVLSELASNVLFTDQIIPSFTVLNNVAQCEILVGTILVKIAGNSANLNTLKIPNTINNIKLKTDASSKIYFGFITSTVFTPKSNETCALTIKGHYL
jgi:hypothetical protein